MRGKIVEEFENVVIHSQYVRIVAMLPNLLEMVDDATNNPSEFVTQNGKGHASWSSQRRWVAKFRDTDFVLDIERGMSRGVSILYRIWSPKKESIRTISMIQICPTQISSAWRLRERTNQIRRRYSTCAGSNP